MKTRKLLLLSILCAAAYLPQTAPADVVKMTPLTTFVSGTNATLVAAKAYTDEHSGGSGGCDTNAVKALIAPATNAVLETSAALFAPTSTAVTVASQVSQLSQVSQTVDLWENYWTGDRVRLSVTNYYGNTSGEPPRLRIEEFDHSVTTTVSGVNYITNVYKIVWDEVTRQTNYYAATESRIAAISNSTMTAAYLQTYTQLAGKAPRAWGEVTSSGEKAPSGMVWHTAPQTVFAGGTEYAHVAVGEGEICVLVDKGAPVYTEGSEGQFRFTDEGGDNYFGFDIRDAYTVGCRTDGIAVTNGICTLTYDLTGDNPSILSSTNLVDWADASPTWLLNPPTGTKICYFNVTGTTKRFYKAEYRYQATSKFVTSMAADLMGGILATNETSTASTVPQVVIYPAITSTGVVWRVRQ